MVQLREVIRSLGGFQERDEEGVFQPEAALTSALAITSVINTITHAFLSYSRHGGQEVWGLRTLTSQLTCWVPLGRMAFGAG